ncbi:MAG: alpha/beta hydrolase [Clostridiales Family XIII bacterium]|jgi:acetyl esterase/lipase|nr:alpha/beta hydrolase [Clostridiales Family XIII bacterium]
MNPLFEDYQDKAWLTHTETEPSKASAEWIPKLIEYGKLYPMAPGSELEWIDDSTPEGIIKKEISLPTGLLMYSYRLENPDKDEKRVIFYIHGGGFMRGNTNWCRSNSIRQVENFGLPTYACTYRYTPAFKYPAGLNDVESGYDYLVNELGILPENIILTGESAGGTYVLALCARLRRQGRALPSKIIIMSGYLDFTLQGESYRYNIDKDIIFSVDISPTVPYYTDKTGDALKDPEISPIYSDFTGYPPTYFIAEDTEIFVSDALSCADRMDKAGVPVKVHIMHGLWHCFQFETPDIEESKMIYKEMKEWLG